jgi:cytochrome P450
VSLAAIDLSDPHVLLREDVLDDPIELYDRLREDAPVWQIPGQDTFMVSEPKLIRDAVNRPEDFSSNLVSLLHDGGDGCPVALDMAPLGDPIHVLATADPPVHTVHRKLLQQHLSPAAVAALEPKITRIVEDQLEVMLGHVSGPIDAVATFSDPVPSRTVCALVGLPESDAGRITQLVGDTGALLDGVTRQVGMSAAMHAAMELTAYVREHLGRSLEMPADERRGLLGVFSSQIESGEVSAGEVVDMLVVLVSAGSETTASLIATTIATLAQDPELQQRLRAHPEELPAALERILRADGPFQFHYRYVPADTELGGVQIPAQSRVLLMWAAANRPAPGSPALPVVDDERGPAPHFAFGRGLHFCIGAPVARLEARLAIERLLAATEHFELDPDLPVTRRPSIFIRRHAALPLRVRAR